MDRIKLAWQIFAWLLGIVVAGLVSYNASGNTMSNRVTKLETQQEETAKREQFFHEATDRRFLELRDELKQVNDQLRKLIDLEITRGRNQP